MNRAIWDQPGATGPVVDLIDTELAQQGRVRTGPPELVRRWSISTVLLIPTDQGPVWFKAVPPVFAHEGALARWVASAQPRHAAAVLGSGPGWLLTEGLPEGGRDGTGRQEGPLAAAVRVQRASIGRSAELIALGCPERSPARITADLDLLVDRTDLLGGPEAQGLVAALPELTRLLEEADGDGTPTVLVHGDIQEENALWTGRSWALIDWTDAALTHPFAELARPLMQATPGQRARAEAEFTQAWADVLSPRAVSRALRLAPVLGAAHQVGNYVRIVEAVGATDGLDALLREWVRRLLAAAARTAPRPARGMM